jgi:hypothetical protein
MSENAVIMFSKKTFVYPDGEGYVIERLREGKKIFLTPTWALIAQNQMPKVPSMLVGEAMLRMSQILYSLGRTDPVFESLNNPNIARVLAIGGDKFPMRFGDCPANSVPTVYCVAFCENKLVKTICVKCYVQSTGIMCDCGVGYCLHHYAEMSSHSNRLHPVLCVSCGKYISISGEFSKLGAEKAYKCGFDSQDISDSMIKGLGSPMPAVLQTDDENDILFNVANEMFDLCFEKDLRFPCPRYDDFDNYPKDFNEDTGSGLYAGVPSAKKREMLCNAMENLRKVHDNARRMPDERAAAYIHNYLGGTVHKTATKVEMKTGDFIPFVQTQNGPAGQYTDVKGGRCFFIGNLEAYLVERMFLGPFCQFAGFGKYDSGTFANQPIKIGMNFTENAGLKLLSEIMQVPYSKLMRMSMEEIRKFDADFCTTNSVYCSDKRKWDLHVSEFMLWICLTQLVSKIDFGPYFHDIDNPDSEENINRINRLFVWAIVRALCVKAIADPNFGVYVIAGVLASGRYATSFLNSYMNVVFSRFIYYLHQQIIHKVSGPFSKKFYDENCQFIDIVYGDDDAKSFKQPLDVQLWVDLWKKYANQEIKLETMRPVKHMLKFDGFHTSINSTFTFLKCSLLPIICKGTMNVCMVKMFDQIAPKLFLSAEKYLTIEHLRSRLLCVAWSSAPNKLIFDMVVKLFLQLDEQYPPIAEISTDDSYIKKMIKRGYVIETHLPSWSEAMKNFLIHNVGAYKEIKRSWKEMSYIPYDSWNGCSARYSIGSLDSFGTD